jgi:hypothetical protein
LPHQFRRRDGTAIVADGDDSRILHPGNFGERFAFTPHGGCADGPDACVGSRCGSINDGARHCCVVVNRLRIGHAAYGRESAGDGRASSRLDGLGNFLAGFAQVAMQVNETGSDDRA